jgi:hypothetical protein
MPPHLPPLQVSPVHDVNRSLLVTGFGYEHDDCWLANMELFKHYTDVAQGVRRLGSAAIDLCHVASGGWRGRAGAGCVGKSGKAPAGRCALLCVQPAYYWGWQCTGGTPMPQPLGLQSPWLIVPLCRTAAGMAEAYWEYRLKPWDMAAGVLIVEEAGGSVTTMDGRAFSGRLMSEPVQAPACLPSYITSATRHSPTLPHRRQWAPCRARCACSV